MVCVTVFSMLHLTPVQLSNFVYIYVGAVPRQALNFAKLKPLYAILKSATRLCETASKIVMREQ